MVAIACGWRYGFVVLGMVAIVSSLVPAICYRDQFLIEAQTPATGGKKS